MSHAAARAALLHMLPCYLASAEIDAEPVFRCAGMSVDDVTSAKIVRRSQINAALSAAAKYVGVAEIGLALGGMADPDRLGPIGAAMKAGATVEGCLRAQMALMPGMQSHVEISLRADRDEAVWLHRLVGDDETAWLLDEGAAAFNAHMLKKLLGPEWTPERVSFRHARRGRQQAYEEFFQSPVLFGHHDETRIYFKPDALSKRLPGKAKQDRALTFEAAGLECFSLNASDIELAIGRMVDATMPHKLITLQKAAAVLGLSPRTLQRRLDDQGLAFEQIIDSRRHNLAIQLLTMGRMSVTSVAMLLGYSDVSHFHRAFRRWEGCSPADFRRNHWSTGTTGI